MPRPGSDQWALHLSSSLKMASSRQLESLLSQGKTLIGEATAQARKMVQEQAMAPIIDVVTIEASGEATETGTLPLFPVISCEDREHFFASIQYSSGRRIVVACRSDSVMINSRSGSSRVPYAEWMSWPCLTAYSFS